MHTTELPRTLHPPREASALAQPSNPTRTVRLTSAGPGLSWHLHSWPKFSSCWTSPWSTPRFRPSASAFEPQQQHDLQWLVTAYLLISGGGLLLGGRVADLLPRRRVFLTGHGHLHHGVPVQRLRLHRRAF